MDENQFELAEHLEQEQRRQAIALATQRAAPERHPDFNGSDCVDCEAHIPAARLALGRVRCVHCQERIERRRGA